MSESTHTGNDPGQGDQADLPQIPGYRVLRVLGTGGMSTIYLGEQRSLRRQVAIKVMLPEALTDEIGRRRFENEARTIARLEHPHIVGIHEVGRTRDDGLPYYVMPYLARGHLGQRDLKGNEQRIRATLRALLSALAYAHSRGVIHRDVKPENVLFDESERPLLADFGIALHRGYGSRVTSTGTAVGSTAYMAPEQARGTEVDFRADLYSVGVLAWEMLTGELPFKAADALSMAVMHAQDPVPRLPPPLRHWQGFIDKSMAKSPRRRYQDAAQMLAAVDRVPLASTNLLHGLGKRWQPAVAKLRKLPPMAWVGAVVVLAAGIGLLSRSGEGEHRFFRAQPGAVRTSALPSPAAVGGSVTGSPDDALLRAAPESTAELLVAQGEEQLRAGRLTAPAGNNAHDSLLAAWQSDPSHLRLAPALDKLIEAMGREAAQRLGDGQVTRARELVAQADRLAAATARKDGAALRNVRSRVLEAFGRHVDRAGRSFDRQAALDAIADADKFGLPARDVAALRARAQRIPSVGDVLPDPSGRMQLVRSGDDLLAASMRPVSRGEYSAFASATGRKETLCRERASLLRIVARRSWQTPGFEQGAADPVVCVSWQDASAYAEWLGRRHGTRYRLPSATEARQLPAGDGARAVAEWARDCSGGCGNRLVSGRSWRGDQGTRPLDASRGYDDVGFRLVREP
ncbi:bifunctional serine/threonine-protein kinase/formylglycine-generating enzyme family protein [Luteimonas vadosa]|uniref:Protein kinase domain-containing protein n=1 Tax=Luteimonas vadosa TaxID=1165507 RepID=A0ABP9E2U0_9GAMM